MNLVKGVLAGVRSWTRRLRESLVTCQECGYKVRFREDICQQCGKRDPVKVPISAVMVLFGLCFLCITIVSLLKTL